MSAPAAAVPAIAPRLRARVDPASIVSMPASTATFLPFTVTPVTPRPRRANLPFSAGSTSVTPPLTVLPAGNTTRSPTITFSLIVPVQLSPTFACSLETCVSTLTWSAVPASTLTPLLFAGADEDDEDVDDVFGLCETDWVDDLCVDGGGASCCCCDCCCCC